MTLIMSCTKDPIDETLTQPGEFESEVVSCDLEIMILQDSEDASLLTAITTGGTAPFDLIWSTGETGESITATESIGYAVGITDAEGCYMADSLFVNLGGVGCDGFMVDISASIDTVGYLITAYVFGGTPPYTYLWITNETGQEIYVDADGDYEVTVTDSEGCTTTALVTADGYEDCADFNGELIYDATANIVSVDIFSGTAPFTYEWSTGETSSTIMPGNDGNYSVIVTDSDGCAFYAIISVNVVGCFNFEAYILLDTLNNSLNATSFGGTAPYTYDWSTGETTTEINITIEGEYALTVTDAEGCSSSYTQDYFLWEDCDGFNLSFDYDESAQTLTGILVGGTAPYTFSWNTGETTETIDVVDGIYTLDVVDANGCLRSGAFDVP